MHPFERMRAERAAMMPRLQRLQAHWPDEVRLWIDGNESVLYHTYPFMLRGAYPAVDVEALRTLSMGLWMLCESVFVSDKVVDGDTGWAGDAVLRVQAMQFEAYAQLHRLFPADSPFWARAREAWTAYARNCALERRLAAAPETVTRESSLRVARGKFPFSKLAVHGLAALACDDAKTEPLVASVDGFDLFTCLWDDVRDWRKDLAAGAPSTARGWVQSAHPELRGAGADDADAFGRALFGRGHAGAIIAAAGHALHEAQQGVAGLGAGDWVAMLASLERVMEEKLRVIRSHVGTEAVAA